MTDAIAATHAELRQVERNLSSARERIAELEDLLSRALPYLPMGPIKKDKIGDEVARALTK